MASWASQRMTMRLESNLISKPHGTSSKSQTRSIAIPRWKEWKRVKSQSFAFDRQKIVALILPSCVLQYNTVFYVNIDDANGFQERTARPKTAISRLMEFDQVNLVVQENIRGKPNFSMTCRSETSKAKTLAEWRGMKCHSWGEEYQHATETEWQLMPWFHLWFA